MEIIGTFGRAGVMEQKGDHSSPCLSSFKPFLYAKIFFAEKIGTKIASIFTMSAGSPYASRLLVAIVNLTGK